MIVMISIGRFWSKFQDRTSKRKTTIALLIRYLSPNAKLNFAQCAVNRDTVASAKKEKRKYRIGIGMDRYTKLQYRYQ